ncbi:MAG TPA: CHAP domain-containing protein [Gaiellaceae bacterium]
MSATDVAAAVGPGRRALAEALRHVGVRESPSGSNRTMFGRWFGADGVPWCAIFASYCFSVGAGVTLCRGWHGAGVTPRGVAYVPTLEAWLRATRRSLPSGAAPAPGDLAVFDWDGGLPDHVGIVIAAHAGRLETVEGNTGVGDDSDGGEVMRRSRRPAQVSSFGRL